MLQIVAEPARVIELSDRVSGSYNHPVGVAGANGQETGKIFQRKMFHVLTGFFSPRSFLCSILSSGQLVLVPALRPEVVALMSGKVTGS